MKTPVLNILQLLFSKRAQSSSHDFTPPLFFICRQCESSKTVTYRQPLSQSSLCVLCIIPLDYICCLPFSLKIIFTSQGVGQGVAKEEREIQPSLLQTRGPRSRAFFFFSEQGAGWTWGHSTGSFFLKRNRIMCVNERTVTTTK